MIFNSLYPLISEPTRITSPTATLIDKIFTNNLEHSMNSGILYTDLSNHLPSFQVTHLKLDAESFRQKRLARLINSATIAAFRSRLETTEWSLIYNSDSTIDSSDTFSSLPKSYQSDKGNIKCFNVMSFNPGVPRPNHRQSDLDLFIM